MALATLSKTDDSSTGRKTVNFIGRPIDTHTMTVNANVLEMIIKQLTDLYKDPIKATVRETISNAIDATILARAQGQDAPNVDVQTPSSFDPTFMVTDHGVGMDAEQLYANFADYGNSTKLDDMTSTGSKGLGAKAPLAYTTTVVVTTVKDGHKIVLTLNRGNHSNEAEKIFDGDADEPNGTQVKVPVRVEDVSKFSDVINDYRSTATPDIPMNIDEKPIVDDFNKTWSFFKDLEIAKDAQGHPVMGSIYLNKNHEYFKSLFSNWISYAQDYWNSDGSIEANRNFVAGMTSISLMGWRYSLSDYHDMNTSILVKIQPGVVDFPPSRDDIKTNDRFYHLTDAILSAFNLDRVAETKDTFTVADTWADLPEEYRYVVLDYMIAHVNPSNGRIYDSLKTVWPDESKTYLDDPHEPSFRAIIPFYGSNVSRYTNSERFSMSSLLFIKQHITMNDQSYRKFSGVDANVALSSALINNDVDKIDNDDNNRMHINYEIEQYMKYAEANDLSLDHDLRVPLSWLEHKPDTVKLRPYDNIRLIVIKGDFDPTKSYRRLRRWVKQEYRDLMITGCSIVCCIYDGNPSDTQFDALKQALSGSSDQNDSVWLGVKDWDDLKIVSTRSSTGGSTISTVDEPSTVKGHLIDADFDLHDTVMDIFNEGMNGSLTCDDEFLIEDLVDQDASFIFFDDTGSYSWVNIRRAIGVIIRNYEDMKRHPVFIVDLKLNSRLYAKDVASLIGYDRIWVADRLKSIVNLKAFKLAKNYSLDTEIFCQAVFERPDVFVDEVSTVLSSPIIVNRMDERFSNRVKASNILNNMNLAHSVTDDNKFVQSLLHADVIIHIGAYDTPDDITSSYINDRMDDLTTTIDHLKDLTAAKRCRLMQSIATVRLHAAMADVINDDQDNADYQIITRAFGNWYGSSEATADMLRRRQDSPFITYLDTVYENIKKQAEQAMKA
jgi:hypothetical protein